MNDPNACREHFHRCHCMLPVGHVDADGNPTPHECVPDPLCGGSWLRHQDDEPGMVRVYRYPNLRPGCDNYESSRGLAGDTVDPSPGEYALEHDGIFRAPRGGIRFLTPPEIASDAPLREFAARKEQQLLDQMRSPDA